MTGGQIAAGKSTNRHISYPRLTGQAAVSTVVRFRPGARDP
jgi:hypothetical protein